jgi:prophage antirepressor-like protein
MHQCTGGARVRGNGTVSFTGRSAKYPGRVCTEMNQAAYPMKEADMTDDTHANQTPSAGRKRGNRRGGPPAPEGDVDPRLIGPYQSLTEEEILPESVQAITPVPFEFEGKTVRTILKDGDIWFVAMDACAVLEHSNSRMAISGLDDDERGVSIVYTPGGPQRMNVVNESGLYSLVFTSRKPEAKAFRRWVMGVVLPTLRRTGKFDMRDEPNQSATAKHQAEDITVTLPRPGRYLVVLFHDGERRIEPICFSDAFSAMAALDCRSIAYSHLTAAALWEKLQHLRTLKAKISGGFTEEKLNATMQAGADLARQILYTYDEPMLIPRPAAKAAD